MLSDDQSSPICVLLNTSVGTPHFASLKDGATPSCVQVKDSGQYFLVDFQELILSESVRLIVDAFVNLKDREKLEDLRQHRQMLRAKLQATDGINASSSMRLIDSDLSEIEAGLARLQ